MKNIKTMAMALTLCSAVTCSSAAPVAGAGRFGYDDMKQGIFVPRTVQGVRSMNDGEHYTTMSDGKILEFSYGTGEQTAVVFDSKQQQPVLPFTDYAFSSDERRILLTTEVKPIYRRSFTAEYWIYDREEDRLIRLSAGGPQQVAQFSPDATRVAFVRGNNLYVVDLATGSERQITSDGLFNHIINGIPDWVYEEEFGFSRAFAWSPDGKNLAWMRFDESRVREYNMNRFEGDLYPENYSFKYPKAGEQNSIVEVYNYNLESGRRSRIDTGKETDQYIPRVKWTPAGGLLVYRLNRPQNHFELLLCDAAALAAGAGTDAGVVPARVIYDERDPRYVERVDDECVTFLPDGERFVVRSEKDGFTHLYLYSAETGFLNRITSGDWEVTALAGIEGDRVYYLSTETSPLKRDLYSIRLNGKDKRRLTDGSGTSSVAPTRGFRYFISYFSNVSTPNRVTLHAADGKLVRTLEDNVALRNTLSKLNVPEKEFFTFRIPEGIELNGYMIRPADFDSTRSYPLFMVQYSGPGSQRVADSWSMGWEDVLVQQGYIVACVDGRGTGFRGSEFKKCTYKQLGKYEVEDQIAAARYLGALPYIDSDRIGIFGWSYGGFMALNCILKGNDVFKMAIAVAPVTSWRFYDTIYTEIYNGDPNENPSGYDDNSPINFADRLKGKLLIAHGTADDNVHIQNTYEMVARLVQHDKPFEMYIYPDRNHSMGNYRNHLMERCIEFVHRNL